MATFQIYSRSEILIVLSFEREEFSWLECVTYLSIVISLFIFLTRMYPTLICSSSPVGTYIKIKCIDKTMLNLLSYMQYSTC